MQDRAMFKLPQKSQNINLLRHSHSKGKSSKIVRVSVSCLALQSMPETKYAGNKVCRKESMPETKYDVVGFRASFLNLVSSEINCFILFK